MNFERKFQSFCQNKNQDSVISIEAKNRNLKPCSIPKEITGTKMTHPKSNFSTTPPLNFRVPFPIVFKLAGK
jgi:hypothetical protein